MSIEKRIKEKAKKVEVLRDQLGSLQNKKEELLAALKEAEELENELKEKVYQIEDYFIEHNSSLQVRTIEIINNVRIDILVAHHKTATFAVFGGLITSAKADPEDEFIPEVGEAIAIQRLINKILELNYGAKF